MAQFVRHVDSEQTFLVSPIQGPFGSVQGDHEARDAVMATATVELQCDSSNGKLSISGILSHHGRVQEEEDGEEEEEEEEEQEFPKTPLYIVYAHEANRAFCWSSTWVCRAVQQLRYVSIPHNVRELCDRCFYKCKSLCRVTFGPCSSLERIGVSCFERSGVEEVSIPDGVCELCDYCFENCESLRRVMFGSSSSLERIGVSCFRKSSVEAVLRGVVLKR